MGIASLALTFPLGNPSRFEFGRSVVAACPDYGRFPVSAEHIKRIGRSRS